MLPHAPLAPDWGASVAFRYRKRGASGVVEPVRHVAPIALADLKEVDGQKERLVRNTEQFVAGRPANNVLLTGARGTGKSSLIKACLNAFAPQGLRLIEVDKTDLVDLPDLVDLVAARPERFIVFCDDLSFEDGEPGYKALKSNAGRFGLGNLSDNVLIYATSNRRHLLPEYMKENLSYTAHRRRRGAPRRGGGREDLAVRAVRPVGQLLSLLSQAEYLAIVAQWLTPLRPGAEVAIERGTARGAGLVWALERGSRSGRVAYQFAKRSGPGANMPWRRDS